MSSQKVLFLGSFFLYTLYYRLTIHDAFNCDENPTVFPGDCCCEVYSGVICLQFPSTASQDCYALYEEAMIARAKVKMLMNFLVFVSLLYFMWEMKRCCCGEANVSPVPYTYEEFNVSTVSYTYDEFNDSPVSYNYEEFNVSPSRSRNGRSPNSYDLERRKLILQNFIQSKVPRRRNDLMIANERTSLLSSIPNTLPVITEDASIDITTEDEEKNQQQRKTSFKGACPVCLEDYKEGDDVAWSRFKCNHVFHWHCIQDWLMESEECPMCRVKLF